MMKNKLILLFALGLCAQVQAQVPHLSRETYRERVEAYSQVLKQQHLKSMASTDARKIAFTGFLPKVDISAEGTLNLKEMDSWDGPAGQYRNHTYQGIFVVSQPLYTGGALQAQNRIAKADEKLDQLSEELTRDQIHYQSDAFYWNASSARAMLKEAELQYINARQNYTLALQKLNILMGEEPNAPVDSLCAIGVVCPPVTLLPLDDVLQRRADFASTEVNIQKSEAQRKAALSQYNPQVSMYVTGGWATASPNMGYDVKFTPIVGMSVNIPVLRWGARFKTNRQQKAYTGIQKLQQSYVVDQINQELAAALTKLKEAEEQVKTAEENKELAEENLDLITFSYNEGKASMVDVLSAQLSWTQAHTSLINAYLAEKMQ